MSTLTRQCTRRLALSILIPTLALGSACTDSDPVGPDPIPSEPGDAGPLNFPGAFTSLWTRSVVQQLELTPTSTLGVLPQTNEQILPGYWLWDSWPVRTPDGAIARIGEWYVLVSLTAPDSLLPGARHGKAELRYLISRDGEDWQLGARLFTDGNAEGSAQWAGSTIYDPATNRITVFYTALGFADGTPADDGTAGESRQGSDQRLVMVQGSATSSASGVTLSDWGLHRVIVEPGGQYYERKSNSKGIWAFRDPWFFKDPRSGRSFLLFTANLSLGGPNSDSASPAGVRFWPTAPGVSGVESNAAGMRLFGSHGGETPTNGDPSVNGVVGMVVAENDALTSWRKLPPLIAAIGVNSQLERPHFIVKDDKYYLFFSSHEFTFAEGLNGPDGLYGFVGDSLTGLYAPLNGTGLVAGNPTAARFQTYSYLVLPNLQVVSFVGYQNLGGVGLDGIGSQTPEWQRDRFAGTLAPPFSLTISGAQTSVSGFNGTGFRLLP